MWLLFYARVAVACARVAVSSARVAVAYAQVWLQLLVPEYGCVWLRQSVALFAFGLRFAMFMSVYGRVYFCQDGLFPLRGLV